MNSSWVIIEMAPSSPSVLGSTQQAGRALDPDRGPRPGEAQPSATTANFGEHQTRSSASPRQLGAFIAQGAAAGVVDHALACLLGLLGLRVGEACKINIEDLAFERGHRTVTVLGKGSKLAIIPLPPRVRRAVGQAAGDRAVGPLLRSR